MTTYRKKLIEVALPLDAINAESSREKSIRHGHPSTLHLWWARRPLAACRAVLFSSLVDDPAEPDAPQPYLEALDELAKPNPLPAEWEKLNLADQRRARLFHFIGGTPVPDGKGKVRYAGGLVAWESTNDEQVIGVARRLIDLACEGKPPPVLDPFCGGGSIPLEAQRLGLEAHASDLNPVAVLITKALVEIPPTFAHQPPVNPDDRSKMGAATTWKGAAGLAADVRYYGRWMRDEAQKRIGHFYPKAKLSDGREATVIAWLWARTVKCPNPGCGRLTPLLSSFILSSRPGNEAFLFPDTSKGTVSFGIVSNWPDQDGSAKRRLDAKKGYKRGTSGIFECAFCGTVTTRNYVAAEGQAGRLGDVATAVVTDGPRGRLYLDASSALQAGDLPQTDTGGLEAELSPNPRDVWCRNFGLRRPVDLFTRRQLVALTTFSDLVGTTRALVLKDALEMRPEDGRGIDAGGSGATAYADAIATYLALAVDKGANLWSSLTSWMSDRGAFRETFARQALPMVWDFAEANPFSEAGGNLHMFVARIADVLNAATPGDGIAKAKQLDAAASVNGVELPLIATDPPYYDNIDYADLSDFFYVWLRRSLRGIYTESGLFETLLTPKERQLVASPYRFGGNRQKADDFFRRGLEKALSNARGSHSPDFPLTLYYAFKQTEEQEAGDLSLGPLFAGQSVGEPVRSSTGWETMLESLLRADFMITGTLPVRTESGGRIVARDTNALASSIIIACRPRPEDAPSTTRLDFLEELGRTMRQALPVLASGRVAPVDLAQAAIGPGMAVYSQYAAVVRQDGQRVTVREALQDINSAIASYRAERVSSFDPLTRFCSDWYDQYGFGEAPFGDADNLARAKNVGVNTLVDQHLLIAERGRSRLVPLGSYPVGVAGLERPFGGSAWEACLRLAATLHEEGEAATAALARQLGEGVSARARELSVWLYTIADARRRSEDALAFNALDASWLEIQKLMAGMDRGLQARL